ncbi:MAG: hypothetical protein V1899_08990 [Planctomycetota bacterium]
MSDASIQIQLTKFEQIEILRAEIELREQEFRQIEKQIRNTLYEVERQKYLQTVHKIFTQLSPPATVAQLPQLQTYRHTLIQALEAMQTTLVALEDETANQTAPPSRGLNQSAQTGVAGAARRPKFNSFEDFRTNKLNG